jgi:tetratricopeptide (TPR) repeat protein
MSLLDRFGRFFDDALLPEDVRGAVERAEKLLAEGHAREAEAAFRRVLDARPQLGRALLGWGRALLETGDLTGARVALAEAQKASPDDPRIAVLSARLALEAGELGAALSAAREATRRLASEGGRPFAEACALRASVESRRGRPDRAARELRKAVAAAPDDVTFRVALVVAFADAWERASALRAARELAVDKVDETSALEIGLALSRLREGAAALPWLEKAAARGEAAALGALARHALSEGAIERAEGHARMAVARGGGARALALLADVLVSEADASAPADAASRARRENEASEALLTAASATADPEIFVRATRFVPLRTSAGPEGPREIDRVADAADRAVPGLASTRALRAWSLLLRGQHEAARALLVEPLTEPRALLAAARLALVDRTPGLTLALLDRVESDGGSSPSRGDALLAAELRRDALRALWRGPEGEVDLAAAIDGVVSFAKERGLAEGERRGLALRDELDRPLLLAILGEFNAGKSTLVNAFLGADVAPTGILPTTATLNVLRGGAEKLVRVVRKDGTTREGEHGALRGLLAEAEAEGAIVDRVEITLPSELLERVWILDTPGSNAPNPEHEALAQEALRRADVALWVFDAGQAGKATEGRILAGIRASKREVIAALNKVDRLKPEELARVMSTLVETMPELGGQPVPLSAKAALKARLASDDDAYRASGFATLLERLERDVFARARPLKRRACAGRLFALLDDALATEPEALTAHRRTAEEARAASKALREVGGRFGVEVDKALDEMDSGQSTAIVEAAREVLSFVRPRTGRFGTHDADPEDRAFLTELLVGRFEQLSDRVATRTAGAVSERLLAATSPREAALASGWASLVRSRVEAAVGAPFAHFAGYQAGLLEAGAVRRFFDEVLPTLTLSEAPVADALAGLRASPRDVLRPQLETSLEALLEGLGRELESRASGASRDEAALRTRTYDPLRALRDVLSELVT